MRALSSPLRKQLETSVLAARRAAEGASRAAIESLGVFLDRRPDHLDAHQAALRNGLRAQWRQLGSDRELLVAECAYEQWHRLLFARFLAENKLLLHPSFKAPVSLADCEELAAELGEPDAWSVAARFAAEILPGIFRLDDPCVRMRLAPEGRHALEQILDGIPADTFAADDALGWVYQFWQKDKKDEVNASERKIGGADLGPVTQLFTENYMVRFLLENSLGAWWVARHPDSPLVKDFDYLRVADDGNPVTGSFDGWPDRVTEISVMDPCCGSGHFLVEAFSMLWQMRAEEEGLSPVDAQDAVIRDNLFGLELDPRCVQIAMFAVALHAWKAGAGWRPLPVPAIACSGIPVKARVEDWKALARGDQKLENALVRLHALFREADTLGSLIDPRRDIARIDIQLSLDDVGWDEVGPLIGDALAGETHDPVVDALGSTAVGVATAASLLLRDYTIVTTNVPFLGRGGQSTPLLLAGDLALAGSHVDLATMMLDRISRLCTPGGCVAVVSPQNWTTAMPAYEEFRRAYGESVSFLLLVRLGARAFSNITGEVVQPSLLIATAEAPVATSTFRLLDSTSRKETPHDLWLRSSSFEDVSQSRALARPGAAFASDMWGKIEPLAAVAIAHAGSQTGDDARYRRFFWEVGSLDGWDYYQTSSNAGEPFGGRDSVVKLVGSQGAESAPGAVIRGRAAWGKRGIAIARSSLQPSLYSGAAFNDSITALVPIADTDLSAVWAFARSEAFARSVRTLSKQVKVGNKIFEKLPFDIDAWRKASSESPIPEDDRRDLRQWTFSGQVHSATNPLHVAVAHLVGYRWPDQLDLPEMDELADGDGIVCLPPVAGEPPAADRLQRLLAVAYGDTWSPGQTSELLDQAGSKKKNLADWLRDEFFKQHCVLFSNRPFVWHIWDGLRDGFSALVNYHRLDSKKLEKLTYTYLGQDWVERQRAGVRDEVAGAETRLAAALELQRKLELVLDGEVPYDIFVRWKDSHEQPVGWEPDIDDGVRPNIRPFVKAEILRAEPKVNWTKDGGKDLGGSERLNDQHISLSAKAEALKRVGRK